MNNTTRFSIATLSALISVYALYFIGVLLGAEFYTPLLEMNIPIFAYAALTVFSAIGAFLVGKGLTLMSLKPEPSKSALSWWIWKS